MLNAVIYSPDSNPGDVFLVCYTDYVVNGNYRLPVGKDDKGLRYLKHPKTGECLVPRKYVTIKNGTTYEPYLTDYFKELKMRSDPFAYELPKVKVPKPTRKKACPPSITDEELTKAQNKKVTYRELKTDGVDDAKLVVYLEDALIKMIKAYGNCTGDDADKQFAFFEDFPADIYNYLNDKVVTEKEETDRLTKAISDSFDRIIRINFTENEKKLLISIGKIND